jgi:hypothetical protein
LDKNTTSKSLTKSISEKALRFDLTVPFARFVVQNRNEITFPFKRYQMQNVWRADRPQKGRYREFYQCDADVIGTDSLLCEVELVQLYDDVCSQLKIPNVDICINNRKVLSGMVELMGATNLFDDVVITLDKLSAIGLENVKNELLAKGVKSKSLSILDTFLNTKNVSDLLTLLAQSEIGKKGLDFDSMDNKKTKLFVTIVGPTEDRNGHLKLLAMVSQILKEPGIVDILIQEKSKIGIYEEFVRNSNMDATSSEKNGENKLMLLTIKDEEIIQDITEVFLEYGIQDSTIIDTQQMDNLLSKVPLFMGFFNFSGGKDTSSKLILLKIDSKFVNAIVKSLEDIFGDLDTYSGMSVLVLDLYFSKGV